MKILGTCKLGKLLSVNSKILEGSGLGHFQKQLQTRLVQTRTWCIKEGGLRVGFSQGLERCTSLGTDKARLAMSVRSKQETLGLPRMRLVNNRSQF